SIIGGKHIMHLKMNAFAFVVMAVFTGSVAVQMPPDSAPTVISGGGPGLRPLAPKAGMVTMHVEDMDAESVKGAPFCATVTTEHTQAFADGNRIHSSDNSSLCRDSEGRTRREAGLNLLAAAPQNSAPKLITIVDPVAGFRYMIDSESKTAHRMAIAAPSKRSGAGKTVAGADSGKGGRGRND